MNPFRELIDTKPIDNLPDWPGAAVNYTRAYTWMAALAQETYRKCEPPPYFWNGRLYGYTQPNCITRMQKALAAGDEETIKGLNHQFRKYWLK